MIRESFAIAIIISCWPPTKQSLMWHSHRHFAAPVVRVVKQIFAFVDSSSNSWWKTKRKDRVSQKGDNETHTWSLIEREREREHPNLVAALRHCRLSRDVTTAQKSTKNGSGQNLETWGKENRNRNQWLSQIERKKKLLLWTANKEHFNKSVWAQYQYQLPETDLWHKQWSGEDGSVKQCSFTNTDDVHCRDQPSNV